MFFVARNISKGMGTTFKSILKKSYSLDDAVLAISNYSQNMTAGKVQIIVDDAIGGIGSYILIMNVISNIFIVSLIV
jgi:hypothetical protein